MTPTVRIDQLPVFPGRTVRIRGWLYNSRSSGKVQFLLIRDGSGVCQCVVEKSDRSGEVFDRARGVTQESSLVIEGVVRTDDRALGGHELLVADLEVIQQSEPYPITPKSHGVDFLMQHRHLWLRSRRQSTVLRIRSTLVETIRRFFHDREFVLVDTPIFSPSAGEGTSTLFEADYFGDPVYLAQTGQLYLEAACMALGSVYCFGPTFRAEKSKTRRHLTEFWMVEPEVAFADLEEVICLAEELICSVVERALLNHATDLEFLGRDLDALRRVRMPFPRISYTEAVELLHSENVQEQLVAELDEKKRNATEIDLQIEEWEAELSAGGKKWRMEKLGQQIADARRDRHRLSQEIENLPLHMELAHDFQWGADLGGSDETIISRAFDQPVFVHRYPREAKAFYMKQDPDDSALVLNFDLLAPEGFGEIIGGSQREDNLEPLVERMEQDHMDLDPYQWYLDLRRYGSVPHGGFGLGIERTLGWICGLSHVRESGAFPRMMERLYP
jgi:asparaginyl-tRNA synthetase